MKKPLPTKLAEKLILVVQETEVFIDSCNLEDDHSPTGKRQLHFMCKELIHQRIHSSKGHRWLGYIQACIVIGGGATFEQLKSIERKYQL